MDSARPEYSNIFERQIKGLFGSALRLAVGDPSLAGFFLRTLQRQKKAAQTRRRWHQQGLQVPPVLVASITNRCNLSCTGCYAQAQHPTESPELSAGKLRHILAEANELGISIVLLAGGEPLLRPDILTMVGDFPDIIFPLFTNGLLIDADCIQRFRKQRNLIPVISLDGGATETDDRRGAGVHDRLMDAVGRMSGKKIFMGCSLTVTRTNFDILTNEEFVEELLTAGCRAFFFVEYVPVREETADLVVTEEQRGRLIQLLETQRARGRGLFVGFPGDESEFGGCLAAGRGFVHLNAEGRLEPCPFAPYSDVSLEDMSLREALRSEFLSAIRRNHDRLTETRGGCALWENREWVRSLLGHPGQG